MTCNHCTAEIIDGHGNQRYCSPACYEEAGRVRAREKYRSLSGAEKRAVQEYNWAQSLKHKFDLEEVDYMQMYANQSGKCAICGVEQEEETRRLAVDHDHETGKVRGLLCTACNKGLGHFKDSPYLLICAVVYLKESGKGVR